MTGALQRVLRVPHGQGAPRRAAAGVLHRLGQPPVGGDGGPVPGTGLLDLPQQPFQPTHAGHPVPSGTDRSLRLEHVWFRYGDQDVLRDVTVEARPGLTALVGPSGTGKTTMLSLVSVPASGEQNRLGVRTLHIPHVRGGAAADEERPAVQPHGRRLPRRSVVGLACARTVPPARSHCAKGSS